MSALLDADPFRILPHMIALVVAYLVYWLLFKTTLGFEIRSVGANPDAARYAGMNIIKNFVSFWRDPVFCIFYTFTLTNKF